MAYDNAKAVCYPFPAVDFSTGSTKKLKIPRGSAEARVMDILVSATVLFTQVTTPALVQVGDGTTPDIFASLTLGALAAGSTIGGSDVANGIFNAVYLAGNYNSGAGLHDLIATFVAPTGGTPAGTATVIIVVGYDQILT
jgi:hypothetical protein